MLRWLLPAALTLSACAVCPVDSVTDKQFAPVAKFHDDIIACANHDDCNHLCLDVFKIGRDELESCRIQSLITDGAWVVVKYTVPETCGVDDGDDGAIIVGDDGGDDGGDYDCTLDDSCDPPPPPDDPCDDGSCDPPPDDGGGDTGGGDDGGGDDGSEIRKAPTSPRSTLAPRASR